MRALLHPESDVLALIEDASHAAVTHAQLYHRVEAYAAEIRTGAKELVLVHTAPTIDTVVAYLGAMLAGHAVLLVDGEATTIDERYAPRFVVRDGELVDRGAPAHRAHDIHPDLAVLLSTSGTTGSPKLVRLAHTAVLANAASIASYLFLDPTERALAALPLGYSYGLSVLNSHLHAGGTVVFPAQGVLRPEFWDCFDRHDCTSLAGVPYSYALMERVGWAQHELPTLRTMTQAGGRLAPDLAVALDTELRRRGARLVVMYGQTEATARIAYVPPHRLADKAGSIGIAIPGGSLRIEQGELIYEGPNVMMGYAEEPADLARGDELCGVLRTGDLGRVDDDGFFYVTGRLKRIAKVNGLRVNLDEVEALVRPVGPAAALGDGEECLVVYVEGEADAARAALGPLKLRGRSLRVEAVDRLPTTASGKIDYAALAREREASDVG